MNQITIHNTQLPVVEYGSRRIVTMAMVDQVHQRPEGTARRTFSEHRDKFREGEDFIEIDQPDEIRALGFTRPQGGTPAKVLLFTEVGYLMLVKPFTDPLAWDVQRQLVTNYFRPAATLPGDYVSALEAHLLSVKQNTVLALENKELRLRLENPEQTFQAGLTPVQYGRTLNGVNTQRINHFLLGAGWIYDAEADPGRSPKYRATSRARDKYLTEHAINVSRPGKKPFLTYSLTLLSAGAKRLHELYQQQKLPMKSSWDGLLIQRRACVEDLQ